MVNEGEVSHSLFKDIFIIKVIDQPSSVLCHWSKCLLNNVAEHANKLSILRALGLTPCSL